MTDFNTPELQDDTPPSAPAPQKTRKPRRWLRVVVPVATLFIGIGIGSAGKQPATTANSGTAPTTVTVPGPSRVETKTVTVEKTVEPPKPAGIGAGVHTVPGDMAPGTYKTAGPADSAIPFCYWARLKNTSGSLGGIIANGNPGGPATITIAPGDAAFETNGCQPWVKTG